MTTVSTLLNRVRTNINDTDAAGFSPDDLVMYFNNANRFLRRLVLDYKPMLLATPISGTQTAGNAEITLPSMTIKILRLRISGNLIGTVDLLDVDDLTKTGTPEAFAMSGFTKLRLVPIPSVNVAYSLIYVPTGADLAITDTLPWPSEFDDFLVEYVGIRCGMKNEFNMSDEMSVMSLIADQVKSLLCNIEPGVKMVRSYDDVGTVRRVRGY